MAANQGMWKVSESLEKARKTVFLEELSKERYELADTLFLAQLRPILDFELYNW